MAVVLIALGYFLIWPVLLLLINSFNAASDWFVEPRTGESSTGEMPFRGPPAHFARQLPAHLVLTSASAFSCGRGDRLAARAHKIPFTHTLEFLLLGFLHGSRSADRPSLGITLLRSRYRHVNVALKKFILSRPGPFNILVYQESFGRT